jgi:hypothetical protein
VDIQFTKSTDIFEQYESHELFVIPSSIVAMMDYLAKQIACLSPGICIPSSSYMAQSLVEETEDLASNVLPPGLLVVHDTSRGGEDDETELTRGQ